MTQSGRPTDNDGFDSGAAWNSGGSAQGFKDKLRRLVAGYSRNQKIAAAAAVAAVVVGVVVVSTMTGGTEWAPLYTDVSADDGGAIVAALDEQGVPHQLGAGGSTILVPADVVHETRLALADTAMPSDAKIGYGVLDSQGLTTSEFGQRVGYQRAMEGELATTIEALDSVDTAVVHLAIPEDQVFAVEDQQPSASVLIRTKGGGLSEDQVRAVVNLVASAVEGMPTESVTVADSDGNVLAAPGQEIAAGGGGLRQGQTAEFENSVKSQLESLLASVVGPERSRVTVSADLDWDETSVSKELFEPPTTVPGAAPGTNDLVLEESTRNETYTGAGDQAGGVLGPDTPAAAPTGGNSDYSLDEADVRYAVNRAVESTKKAPGAINQMSVAVLVDESAISAQQAQQLTETLAAGANIQDDRGDVLTVTRMPFDDSASKAAEAELERAEAAAQAASQRSLMNKLLLGGLLALLLLSAAISYRRAARRHRRGGVELEPAEPRPALSPAASTMVEEADADDVVELTGSEEGDELGELATDDAGLVLAPLLAGAAVLEPAEDRAERTEALGELIDHQPDEVAALLRGWLGDRRGASR